MKWIISGMHQGSDIKIQFQQTCRSVVVNQALNCPGWTLEFYRFDIFQRKQTSRSCEICRCSGLQLWMLTQAAPRESWPPPGCAKSSNAPGAPSEESHVFLVFIKHHLQESDSLTFRVCQGQERTC